MGRQGVEAAKECCKEGKEGIEAWEVRTQRGKLLPKCHRRQVGNNKEHRSHATDLSMKAQDSMMRMKPAWEKVGGMGVSK